MLTTTNQIESKILAAERYLKTNPDMVFMRWQGQIYDEIDKFVRLDKVYLHVAYWSRTYREARYHRVIPFRSKDSMGEPTIVCRTTGVYRVNQGTRDLGRILAEEQLEEFEIPIEDTTPAGVAKRLSYGRQADQLNTFTTGNNHLAMLLDELFTDPDHAPPSPVYTEMHDEHFPETYITSQPDNATLFLRRGSKLCPRDEKGQPGHAEFRANRELFQIDAGGGRVGYSYADVFGKGVVVVCPKNFGTWYRATRQQLEAKGKDMYIELD